MKKMILAFVLGFSGALFAETAECYHQVLAAAQKQAKKDRPDVHVNGVNFFTSPENVRHDQTGSFYSIRLFYFEKNAAGEMDSNNQGNLNYTVHAQPVRGGSQCKVTVYPN